MIGKNLFCIIILVFCTFFLSACSTYMTGQPSLTLLTKDIDRTSKEIKVVSEQESVSSSFFMGPFILLASGSPNASHEAVINKFLDKYNADLIVGANIKNSWFGIPFLFIVETTTVEGHPAIFVKGGDNK